MTSTVHPTAGATVWRAQAACRDADPEVFYPTGRDPDTRAAIVICHSCPVIDACLQHALDHSEHHGIWGGRTPDERRQLARTGTRRISYLLPRDPDGTGGRARFTTWATRSDITDQHYREKTVTRSAG